ncbi:hypothetical protein BH11CYA1_BH11CYA1_37080 [soil metagenome]
MNINAVTNFLNNLKSKLSLEAPREELAQQACPSARLKQIEVRSREACEAGLIESVVRQKTTVREAAIRWSSNPDGFIRQEIRKPHQMTGNQSNFEIDPMAKLD